MLQSDWITKKKYKPYALHKKHTLSMRRDSQKSKGRTICITKTLIIRKDSVGKLDEAKQIFGPGKLLATKKNTA